MNGNTDKMKAVLYNKKGSPDKFFYCDIDKPTPRENELLIKIHAVSLNAADYRSMKLGFIPGDKVVGTLINFGYGGLAEYVAVSEKAVIKKPDGISFEDASTLPIAGITAIQALRNKGNIQKGQKVLIVGSAGSVGTFAVQLAKYFDTEVTGVCSTKNVQQTFKLGADYVIDYTKEFFLNRTKLYDIILAINGNYPLLAYRRNLTKSGTCIMVGGALSQIFKFLLFGWLLSFGTKKMKSVCATELNTDLKMLSSLLEKGCIKSVIERFYPLNETGDAMKYLSNGHSAGKVVIKII